MALTPKVEGPGDPESAAARPSGFGDPASVRSPREPSAQRDAGEPCRRRPRPARGGGSAGAGAGDLRGCRRPGRRPGPEQRRPAGHRSLLRQGTTRRGRPPTQPRGSLCQVPLPRPRRVGLRVGADSPRATPLQRVRLVAGGVRPRLHVLRDGAARLLAQPRALGDRRAGADHKARVARAPGHGCRVPGAGRALPELRERDTSRRDPARPLGRTDPGRPHHDLDGGSLAHDRALHRGRAPVSADPLAHLGPAREAQGARPHGPGPRRSRRWPGPCGGTRSATAGR